MSPANHSTIIDSTVTAFYQKAFDDLLIGYHFQKIQDWPTHLARTQHFWRQRLLPLASGGPETPVADAGRNLIKLHIPLHIRPGQLGRWKVLFLTTLDEQQSLIAKADEDVVFWQRWRREIERFHNVFYANRSFWQHS